MVTHDVDEAVFLSDRVVMMTDGPEAEVGDILRIPFARPRVRAELMEDPQYGECRRHLLTFLNERSHIRPAGARLRAVRGRASASAETASGAPASSVPAPA